MFVDVPAGRDEAGSSYHYSHPFLSDIAALCFVPCCGRIGEHGHHLMHVLHA